MSSTSGFTLTEVLIALMLSLVVAAAIYSVLTMGQMSSASIERGVTTQQDVRAALDIMAREIQMASYNPTGNRTIWRDLACPNMNQAADLTLKGIHVATADSIMIQMDIDESGQIGDADNEVIQYTYVYEGVDHPNNRITRRTGCGGAQPFLGWNQPPRVVRVINKDPSVDIPVFQYFNGNGATTVNAADIRRVQITLAVESDELDPGTGMRKRMIYSTSVVPRNHAAN